MGRRIMGGVGRTLVTIGVLILLFVAYQLWGTGIYEAREQSRLKDQFQEQLRERDATTTTSSPTPTTTTVAAAQPPEGEVVAIMQIPKIGVERAIVQGVSREDLRKGPGHYPETPMLGQLGNSAVAGHRTTYGAPFNRIDELAPGDVIGVRTLNGTFNYFVDQQADGSGHLIVQPTQVEVVATTDPATAKLTLTTCNPKYSAAQRLVVQATLDPAQAARATKPAPRPGGAAQLDNALSGEGVSVWPTVWWGLIAALVGGLWWLVFHRYHRWTTWVAGAIPFALVLFNFYYYLERVLPGNY